MRHLVLISDIALYSLRLIQNTMKVGLTEKVSREEARSYNNPYLNDPVRGLTMLKIACIIIHTP